MNHSDTSPTHELYPSLPLSSKFCYPFATQTLWAVTASSSTDGLVELSGGGILKARSNMGIGVQGDRYGRVPQAFVDYLGVYPLLQQDSGVSMPQVV